MVRTRLSNVVNTAHTTFNVSTSQMCMAEASLVAGRRQQAAYQELSQRMDRQQKLSSLAADLRFQKQMMVGLLS